MLRSRQSKVLINSIAYCLFSPQYFASSCTCCWIRMIEFVKAKSEHQVILPDFLVQRNVAQDCIKIRGYFIECPPRQL
jgi:hypothetical protein